MLSGKEYVSSAGATGDEVQSLGEEDPLKEGMASDFSIPAWRIPGTVEPGGIQSIVLQRVTHNLPCLHMSHTA